MSAKKDIHAPVNGRSGGPSASDTIVNLAWDETLRELRLRRRLIKQFRQPAPIQELILRHFQAAGWPRSIPSPLPLDPLLDPGVRLRDAVKNLNRAQHPPGIRFHVNHRSTIIYWTLEDDVEANNRLHYKKIVANGRKVNTKRTARLGHFPGSDLKATRERPLTTAADVLRICAVRSDTHA